MLKEKFIILIVKNKYDAQPIILPTMQQVVPLDKRKKLFRKDAFIWKDSGKIEVDLS